MRNMNKSQSSKKASSSSTNRPHAGPVANRLADLRKKHGLSQAELAKQVGITRQAVYAIEANQYLPSTQIALQLAGVLNCQIEDIFSLQEREVVVDAELIGGASTQKKPMRVKLAQVGLRMLARPMAGLGDILNFVLPADGVILEDSKKYIQQKKSACSRKIIAFP
jgi:DNA-binding XRE family transcriptional regulator